MEVPCKVFFAWPLFLSLMEKKKRKGAGGGGKSNY
jgi:hypothetical protein